MPTVCPNPECRTPGRFDGIQHLLSCYRLEVCEGGAEEISNFLVKLAKTACVANPGLPVPAGPYFELELDLEDGRDQLELFRPGVEIWDATEVINALEEERGVRVSDDDDKPRSRGTNISNQSSGEMSIENVPGM